MLWAQNQIFTCLIPPNKMNNTVLTETKLIKLDVHTNYMVLE